MATKRKTSDDNDENSSFVSVRLDSEFNLAQIETLDKLRIQYIEQFRNPSDQTEEYALAALIEMLNLPRYIQVAVQHIIGNKRFVCSNEDVVIGEDEKYDIIEVFSGGKVVLATSHPITYLKVHPGATVLSNFCRITRIISCGQVEISGSVEYVSIVGGIFRFTGELLSIQTLPCTVTYLNTTSQHEEQILGYVNNNGRCIAPEETAFIDQMREKYQITNFDAGLALTSV